jgi:predicted ATPase
VLPKCVGRNGEIAEFDNALDAAVLGRGGLTLITGRAGIGRTALAADLSDRAIARGFAASWSACTEHTAVRPYWPWSQLIEDRLGAVTGDDRPRLVNAVAAALPVLAPGLALHLDVTAARGPAGDEFALFQSVVRFWTAAASLERPLVLVIDDLQRADPASIRLLAHLATMLRYLPVALLATIRTGEPLDEGRAEALVDLDRHTSRTLSLRGLSRNALTDLLKQRGLNNSHSAAIELLEQRTGGNPFFVTEVLETLGLSEGQPISMLALADVLPARATQSVRRQAALLPLAVNRLLDAAAVSAR